jgi:hypothetical protein
VRQAGTRSAARAEVVCGFVNVIFCLHRVIVLCCVSLRSVSARFASTATNLWRDHGKTPDKDGKASGCVGSAKTQDNSLSMSSNRRPQDWSVVQSGMKSGATQAGQADGRHDAGELPQPQEQGGKQWSKSTRSSSPLGCDNLRHLPDMSAVQMNIGSQATTYQPGSAAMTSGGVSGSTVAEQSKPSLQSSPEMSKSRSNPLQLPRIRIVVFSVSSGRVIPQMPRPCSVKTEHQNDQALP